MNLLKKELPRNVVFTSGGYAVNKTINKNIKNYGFYHDKQTAIDIRNWLDKHNWQLPGTNIQENNTVYIIKITKGKIRVLGLGSTIEEAKQNKIIDMTNIYKQDCGYSISHEVNKKKISYRTYTTLREAISMRDWLQEHNWNQEEFIEEYNKRYPRLPDYIYERDNKYIIQRLYKGRSQTYGKYNTLEEAIQKRDWLQAHDWKVKVQQVITEHDGVWFVRKNSKINNKPVKKYYYSTENKEMAEEKAEDYKLNGYPEPFFVTNKYRYINHNRKMYYIIYKKKKVGYAYTLREAVIFRTIWEYYDKNKPPCGVYEYDGTFYRIHTNSWGTLVFEVDHTICIQSTPN